MTQTDKLFVQINGDSVLYPLSSYATEDRNGQFNITNNQTQLELKGNTWKKLDFGVNYTITTDTILEFDFQSTIEGEIHGLGFDNDNVLSTSWLFKLSGTQNVGLRDFDNYVTGSGWQTYQIPVGNFFTGDFQYFVLSNDHDVTSPTGNGQFRNLRIYENVAVLDIAPLDAVQAEGNTGTTPFTFTVTRSGDTTVTSTVNWAVTGTGDNPATADDFDLGVFPRGTLTFEPWDTTNYREITVYVNGDISYEADEGFSVTLSDAVDAIINTDTAEGIILNDDVPPTLDIAPLDAVQAEGNEGLTPFTFTVTRSGDTTATSTVNWAVTLSGTADAADFSLTPSINNSQRETTTPSRPYAPNSQSDTTTPSSPYAPNRLIVKFNREVNSTQANEIKNSLGVVKTQNIRLTGAEIWQLSGTTSVETALATYGKSRVFEYIEPDYIVTTAATIPNDPGFNLLWGLHNTGQTGGTPDADIDAPEAWDIQTGNPDLVIGVIDTGVDYTHPDLVGNIWTNTGEIAGNGIDDDGNGYIDDIRGWDFAYNDNNPMDVGGHGTHVSGTIAGKGNNAVGVTGVAWNAKIMPLKFLDDTGFGSTSNAILAVDYATAQGVKLTNNSWGGGGYSQGLYDAIAAAGDAGSLFIAAAGNDSNNNDSSPSYPASYNLDNIISVASTTHTDGLSWFSNYGLTTVDLGAPGSSIYSTVPGNSYASISGTSMASPHVAGAAALLWSENPTWTAQQVKDVLLQTVDPTETLNGITVSGGRLNVYNALLSDPGFVISVTVSPASVAEDGSENLVYTFTRIGESLDSPLTVNFSASGTANAVAVGTDPADYTVVTNSDVTFDSATQTGTVTFAANADSVAVVVDPIADSLEEIAETVQLSVTPGEGYIGSSAATGTIVSEETLPVFTNPDPISIPIGGAGNPYPATISVSGLSGEVTNVTVTLTNLAHTWPDDIDVLLVGPTGATTILMSDVGYLYGISNTTLTFDAGATAYLPDAGQITSGTYLPTNIGTGDNFAAPAPGGSHGTDLSVFHNTDPNGLWSLYVMDDDSFGDSGSIAGGWSLLIETATTTTLPSGTVTFTAGETTKEIIVDVSGDISYEGDEGFSVTLSDAVDAIINTDTAEGTILNDDTAIDNAQKITSSSNISAAPGGTVTIPLYYDTTTGDNSLPGISLRLHYNSSELTFNNASDLFLTNLFGDVKELPDNENFDNDLTTDRFVQLQYNDFTGDWPNQPLPLKLADLKFATTDSFTGTQVNFSSSNTAAGYALAADSVTVSQGWNLDIDGNGEIKALSDGVILMRHLFGSFIGNELIDGAIDPNATRDLVAIQAYLQEGINQGHLDIDGNGSVGAYSDGIMAVRYMFGTFPGDALTHEALSPDATRDLAQIQNHLEQLTTLV
ncbi:S8 family serine peptidase [Anabaenopsis tanganyikae CS-531]|uniref:S8 family serine peptidase n=1 Tax=Anabaenopsis tanganyikae CS-531 TaxID=2785304 RepID=A0ABT6KFC9_9CYAN|nr:S8 family serine peptidase [Anabaenopsis tanganyikae]MDH6106571.1 S8 family serine peptidase [Anabaenopsis tanganyikae CS-531]